MSASLAFLPWRSSLAAILAVVAVGVGDASAQAEKTKEKAAAAKKIDLNTASAEELETLPGVGPATSKKIIDGRPYKSVEQLAKAGVSEAEIAKIRPLVELAEAGKPKSEAPAAKKAEAEAPGSKVDLNTADQAAIESLPGVGPVLAKAIIAARPYPNVDQLKRVKGLGPAKFDAIKDLVKVSNYSPVASAASSPSPGASKKSGGAAAKSGGAAAKPGGAPEKAKAVLPPGTKININTASLAELDVLPGIGPVRAQAIIDARPFAKPEDIMKVKGIKEVEFGKIKDFIVVK